MIKLAGPLVTLLMMLTSSTVIANSHKDQISDPSKLHKVKIEAGVTKIVAASIRDLNAIHTPFKKPFIIKKTTLNFEVINNVVYFQPDDEKPIGIYITEENDRDAPIYKLTIVPSKVPVGQQIMLQPANNNYFSKKFADSVLKDAPDYPTFLISLLTQTAKDGQASSFVRDENFELPNYYLGNVLVVPAKRTVSANYEIITLEATNRNNETIQLSESDFINTPIKKDESKKYIAAVGFYPKIVLQPGATTFVYLVRARNE